MRRIAYLAVAALFGVLALTAQLFPEALGFDPRLPGVALGFVLVKLPGYQNVAVSNTAIAAIPVGVSYRALFTAITDNAIDPTQATISARYTRWVLKADGTIKWDVTGTLGQELNAYHGHGDQDGVRSTWLTQPKQATLGSEDALMWGTGGLTTLTHEVDVGAAAVGPLLSLYALIDPTLMKNGKAPPLGAHRLVQTFTDTPGGANAEYLVLNMPPRMAGRWLEKVHFKASANAVSAIRMIVNQQELHNSIVKISKSLNAAGFSPFTWQTNYYHFDLTVTRRLSDALNMNIADLRLLLNVTGAMTLTAVWEMIDGTSARPEALQALGMRY